MTKYFLLFFQINFLDWVSLILLRYVSRNKPWVKTNPMHVGIYTFVESTDAMPEELEVKELLRDQRVVATKHYSNTFRQMEIRASTTVVPFVWVKML